MAAAWRKDRFGSDFFRNRSILRRLNGKLIGLLISKLGGGRLLDMCVYWTKFGNTMYVVLTILGSAEFLLLKVSINDCN